MRAQLDFWDDSITRTGAAIILRRIQAVQEIEKLAARIHMELTHEDGGAATALPTRLRPTSAASDGQIAMALTTPVHARTA